MGVKLREKSLKSGRTSLYLDIYHKGKRNYEFLDLYLTGDRKNDKEAKRTAEAIRAKREIELFNEKYDFDRGSSGGKEKSLNDFIKVVSNEFEGRGNRNILSVLYHIKNYKKAEVQFDDIDADWLVGFKKHLLSKVKQSTARMYFLVLRSILNKATGRGLIKGNPVYKYNISNIPKDTPKIEFLTDRELNKLWEAEIKNKEVKRAFLFSAYTGLRLSDCLNLKWSDIRDMGNHKQVSVQQKKTKEVIHIPLNERAEGIIEKPRFVKDKVFSVTESTIQYWLPKWAKKAGLSKHLHFHMARHTFATRLLQKGANIHEVSKLLGHASIASTEKYLHLVDSDKKKAVDLL
jgi:integrase